MGNNLNSSLLKSLDSSSNLYRFETYDFKELKNASLMDRVDTKYLVPIFLLEPILDRLLPYYKALEINKKRVFVYHNTYFDTPEYDFYHAHHQGKLNRYKVRHRSYVDSDKGFLEVKFKNNKGRTIKSRIESNKANIDGDGEKKFLSEISSDFANLKPAQWGSYNRVALACEESGERLTLDFNLRFESIDKFKSVDFDRFFIAELKQGKYDMSSPFAKEMLNLGIRPVKFSKYCIGCSLVSPQLKYNRFKPVFTALNKFN